VTLVTGDVVHDVVHADGKHAITLEPGPDGTIPNASITEVGDHVYVVPQKAMPLLAHERLDLDLFDVAGLVRQGYDDAERATLPVIVDFGRGADAAQESRNATFADASKSVTLASIGAAAFAADKNDARGFWRSLTTAANASGAPTALARGATRVDLDGRVQATLDPDVAQIHAPEAWAAGFDGSGATVAVLDTGYDPTHPDLAGPVTGSANFSSESSTVDGNGHGTHVASTIAGTGAASGGLHGGVAPGAHLLIGKVLDDSGSGEDSWVLAGMQWAVAEGADVVNMSLGGDVSDGTDPLSRAIDDLSASSETLFVVAAGNNGGESTVTAPGAADAALTVGAVDGGDSVAWFSSRGPRAGDRAVKPDVVAPGVGIVAARAAGTSLGNPVDDRYTSLDGTSMATPHVAGVAAILKQEHPDWDGEQIKEVITGSAVAVAGATALDVGTGRVDAARAVADTLLAPASLNLGYYPWPQGSLEPTLTPLTYTNGGPTPVELSLSVDAEDPAGDPPSGVSLSASHLTVAAHGEATVDVRLDPRVPGVGTFSGVISAETPGGAEVRTAFGFGEESEHHDLTVEIRPRAGTQHASHLVGLLGLESGSFEQRVVDGKGPQRVTFRVSPGTYSVGAVTFGLAADGASEGVLDFEPTISADVDRAIVLDGATARPFSYTTDRPAASDGQIMSVDWSTAAGFGGVMLGGAVDRLYARPFVAGDGGTVTAALNWMLSEPDAELTPAGGATVSLRAIVPQGRLPWDVPPVALPTAHVAGAGTVDALDTSSVAHKVAVVAGQCSDLTDAAARLAAAGAVAVVAYAGAGADCAGTISSSTAIPVYSARPYDASRLLSARGGLARFATHASPRYVYDLAGFWPDSVPAGAVLDGSDRRVGAFVEQYDSLGGTSAGGHEVREMAIGWIPDRGVAAFGLVRPVAVPGAVTHYVSPIAEWERLVEVIDRAGIPEGMMSAPRETLASGATRRDTWFGGPIASNVSPPLAALGWQATPYRQGDSMWLYMPPFTDTAGHVGSTIFLDEFDGRLYQDGQLVVEQADDPLGMGYEAPPEAHRYRLVYSTSRRNEFWQRSTATETAWEFTSARTPGDHEVLPLLSVDYELPLSDLGIAPAGAFSFGLALRMPPEVAVAPATRIGVEISWDGGATWAAADLRSCPVAGLTHNANDGKGCAVRVRNRAGSSASLRVAATDAAGRSVTQTVVDAYAVAGRR
jgi:subtilisin family serine protease